MKISKNTEWNAIRYKVKNNDKFLLLQILFAWHCNFFKVMQKFFVNFVEKNIEIPALEALFASLRLSEIIECGKKYQFIHLLISKISYFY